MGFSLVRRRRAREGSVPVQVRAPREQHFSGTGNGLADDFNINAEAEVAPGGIGCICGGLVVDGESEACTVTEREAVLAGLGGSALRSGGH